MGMQSDEAQLPVMMVPPRIQVRFFRETLINHNFRRSREGGLRRQAGRCSCISCMQAIHGL